MKQTVNITCLVACMALASCTADTDPGNDSGTKAVIYATIGEADDAPGSRTAIDPTLYQGGEVGILWTKDDELGVFGGDVRNARFTNTLEEAAGRTAFSGECAEPRYAYYPYSAANDGREATNLVGSLAALQSYNAATGELQGDYKIGEPRVGAENEFDFRHLFALLRFNVDATGTGIEGQQLKGVTLTLPDARVLAGDFTFSAVDGTYQFTDNKTSSVTVNWADTPELTSGKSVQAYMTCAPDLKADDEVTVTVTTATHRATFTRHIAYDFAPATVYTFDLTLSLYKDDLVIEELPEEPVEETANCYMIWETGEHSFLATQIGNGDKGIIPGAGFHVTTSKIHPKSAAVLWQDTENFIDESSVELRADGRVYYKANSNIGNAVIAVYDAANATGNILWSWHIWGVGDTAPSDFELATKGGNTFMVMDRDLGAIPATDEQRLSTTRDAAVESVVLRAMYYQWGRKDPLPNTDKWYVNGEAQAIGNSGYPLLKPQKEEATIEYAVRNPMSFIDLYTTASVSDWIGEHNDMLWGDARFSGQNDGGWTDVKTIYDPSPVGYRVANYFTYRNFIAVDKTDYQLKGVMSYNTTTGVPALAEAINCVISTFMNGTVTRWIPKGVTENRIGMSVDNTKQHGYGIYFKRNDADTDGNFFPQTGFIQGGGKRNSFGISSYRWMSCGAVTNTIDCGSLYLGQFAWRTASSDYTDSDHNKGLPQGSAGVVGTIKTANSLQPRYGCAVRCVREK